MPFDPVLFIAGFIIGGGCIVMLGGSMMDDHDRRIVVPVTSVCALLVGGIVGWSFNYFFHYASMGPR
jgi:ABC-type uncharacterized transport system permease subunit